MSRFSAAGDPSEPRPHPSSGARPPAVAPARFLVGCDGHGSWIVQDREGRIGGLFASETAALHFAREECGHRADDVCRAPEGAVLDFDGGTAAHLH